MANITYLLGAGASAQALPVVSGLQGRLTEFAEVLRTHLSKSHVDSLFDSEWQTQQFNLYDGIDVSEFSIYKTLLRVVDENQKHYSIDTYAKKLYLNGSTTEYIELKALLVCFFLYLQMRKDEVLFLQKEERFNGIGVIKDRETEEQVKSRLAKLKYIDKRYDAFFAAIFNSPENLVLPETINIISWNYDSQFELSYADFIGNSTEGKDFERAISQLKILSKNYAYTKIEPKLIKLNGSTDYYIDDDFKNGRSYNFYNEELKDVTIFENIFRDVVNQKGKCFNFAWESNAKEDIRINAAKTIIQQTNVLVVIGYTFPYYNMEIDKEILAGKHFDTIYIQDMPNQYEAVKERLTYLGIGFGNIKPVKQIDLFFIPPEYIGAPPIEYKHVSTFTGGL